MKEKILTYLNTKQLASSIGEISKEFNLGVDEVKSIIKILRDGKLINATDGWTVEKYTNIEITDKGRKSLESKKLAPKTTTNVKIISNHGNISVGDENNQSAKNAEKESVLSKFFWWIMGIIALIIVSGINYYFDWK